MFNSLSSGDTLSKTATRLNRAHPDFIADVELSEVSFTYHGKDTPALNHVSFTVNGGKSLAIVGPSGSGKTTLVDVLLGLIDPLEGKVLISKHSPKDAIENWSGAIAYVPQNVVIVNGSIRENVTLGYQNGPETEEHVLEALRLAQLSDLIETMPEGLETNVGERGTKLSGGQRQRLGIARALFTNPKLLVLDEATSSLDGQTESDFSEAINSLRGQVTVILIAHRLSTVRTADEVLYLSSGEIVARGTFDEIRNAVPEFEKQAQLLGS
jgi:ABC-type multidrug transport system fused ATPase/permease subunit